jgi:hypothetical protein
VTLLALAEFVQDWLAPVLFTLFLVSPLGEQIRDRTGLNLSLKKIFSYMMMPFQSKTNAEGNNEVTDTSASQKDEETKTLVKQGLKLMFIDVTLQVCMSCSKYISLNVDSATTYQLTALESELPVYGVAYAFSIGVTVKIMGPLLLLNLSPKTFVKFINWTILSAFLLVAVVIGSTVPFVRGLALKSGTNACAYASSSECLPFFDKVMGVNGEGGIFTLPFTYYIFPIASSLEVFLLIFRAILLTCLDFDFMLVATIAAGISYIPAILIVQYASLDFQQQAIGYFAAFYIPQIVLVLCCAVRIVLIIRKMNNDEPGPWSPKREHRASYLESIREATKQSANEVGANEEKSV